MNEIVLLLLILIMPIALYKVFNLFFDKIACILVLGGIGIIGIVFNKQLLNMIQAKYKSEKYEMVRNFRMHS